MAHHVGRTNSLVASETISLDRADCGNNLVRRWRFESRRIELCFRLSRRPRNRGHRRDHHLLRSPWVFSLCRNFGLRWNPNSSRFHSTRESRGHAFDSLFAAVLPRLTTRIDSCFLFHGSGISPDFSWIFGVFRSGVIRLVASFARRERTVSQLATRPARALEMGLKDHVHLMTFSNTVAISVAAFSQVKHEARSVPPRRRAARKSSSVAVRSIASRQAGTSSGGSSNPRLPHTS